MYEIFTNPLAIFSSPLFWICLPFQIWMFVDALRRREWIWAAFIFFFSILSTFFYWLLVYRQEGPAGGAGSRGFELPGAANRRRIREIEARIHNLDHARDHLDLADIYYSQGNYEKAETSYREALRRDGDDLDTRAHLGQCLMRLNRPAEARPLLESVLAGEPKHDYGQTRMALAEALTALGEHDAALREWETVLTSHGYARAKVQFAELVLARGNRERAKRELQEVISDDAHAPKFEREREKVWVRRAHTLLRGL